MPGEVDAEAVRQSPLWSHMVKLLAEVVSERPQDALGAMRATSHYLLTGSTVPPKGASAYADPHPVPGRSAVASDALHNSCWASHFVTALAPPKPPRRPLNGESNGAEDNGTSAGRQGGGDDAEEEEEPTPYDMRVDIEAERQAAELPGSVADVVAEQAVFNQLGVGVPPAEALRLVVGLRQLMKAEPLERVRFWGKIFGTRADYYIAEAKLDPNRLPERDDADAGGADDEGEDEESAAVTESIAEVLFSYAVRRHHSVPREPAGTGLNEFVYYVALDTDPTCWTKLPDVTPQQVSAARLIRRGFSGNLQAPVLSHPRFPGLEQHYLRAQIARIHCGCKVAPRDLYLTEGAVPETPDEDEMETMMSGGAAGAAGGAPTSATGPGGDESGAQSAVMKVPAYATVPPLLPQETPEEEDAEAIQPVQTWYHGYANDELLQGKYWVHIAPTLLQNGRVTTAAATGGDGTGGANAAEEMEMTSGDGAGDGAGGEAAEELIHPFLSDVAKDDPLAFPGHSRANFPGWSFRKGFHNESNLTRVYVARSGRWPGAFTYAVTRKGKPGAQYQMVYVGTGLKNLQGIDYTPQFPPAKMHEYGEEGLVLQRDCTIDEELEYAPPPPRPRLDEDEENDGQEDDGRY